MFGGHQSNDAQALRARHLDALLKKFPAARVISPDKSLIDVPIVLPTSVQITFRITIPVNFPGQAPTITLLATANPHMLLDIHSNVVHPKLSRWTPYVNLADLFTEIVGEFIRSPPSIINQNNPPSHQQQQQLQQQQQMRPPMGSQPPGFYPPNHPASMQRPLPQQHQQQQFQQQQQSQHSHTPLPVIPSIFPELANKSLAELTSLDQNPAKFDELFQNLEWMKNVNCLIDDIRQGNTAIAEKNLSREEEITALEHELLDTKNMANQLRTVVDQKYLKQQEILQQFAPRNLLDKLSRATSQAEQDSDNFMTDFIDNNSSMNPNDFIKQYLEMRTLYYLRKAKKERFARSQGIF